MPILWLFHAITLGIFSFCNFQAIQYKSSIVKVTRRVRVIKEYSCELSKLNFKRWIQIIKKTYMFNTFFLASYTCKLAFLLLDGWLKWIVKYILLKHIFLGINTCNVKHWEYLRIKINWGSICNIWAKCFAWLAKMVLKRGRVEQRACVKSHWWHNQSR